MQETVKHTLSGGQYVLTVVSRHWIACETLTVRKSRYKQASISDIPVGEPIDNQSVITQSLPGPKALWSLHVHTQETVDHTLLRVEACTATVVSRSQCACETVVIRRESNYKKSRICLI